MSAPKRRSRARALYDRCPFAPHQLAARALDRHSRRRDARAAKNPEWAEIESRRHRDGRPGIVLLDGESLGWYEWHRQIEIEERLTPDPFWVPFARWVKDRPWVEHRAVTRAAKIRATKGWAPQDVWSLDTYLCTLLSQTLRHLADTAHGHPSDRTYEEWQRELRHAAAALDAWAGRDDATASSDLTAAIDAEDGTKATRERTEVALTAMREDEEQRYAEAQKALRWVADNLASLWD